MLFSFDINYIFAEEQEKSNKYKNADIHNIDINHIWKVDFNVDLNESSVNNNSIYIEDINGKKIKDLKVYFKDGNNKSVYIKNNDSYKYNSFYNIVISADVKSKWNTPLKEAFNYSFITEDKSILEYSSIELDYFSEIAFGSEWDGDDFPIRKWNNDIKVKVYGNYTDSDLDALKSTIEDIEGITPNLNMEIVDDNENIEIYYVPLNDFKMYVDNPAPGNWGLFYYWYDSNFYINNAVILIATDKNSEIERKHLIREEFTQVLGLANDSWKYSDSMFYQGWTYTTKFSPIDEKLIEILYRSDIKAGMYKSEFDELIRSYGER